MDFYSECFFNKLCAEKAMAIENHSNIAGQLEKKLCVPASGKKLIMQTASAVTEIIFWLPFFSTKNFLTSRSNAAIIIQNNKTPAHPASANHSI